MTTAIQQITEFVTASDESYLTWEDVAFLVGGSLVQYDMVDTSRWDIIYKGVISLGTEFVEFMHRDGATENQENTDCVDELGTLRAVEPHTFSVIKYLPIK